ncbi:MAG: glycosyltransferase [Lachnospiraceae bacterium]
MKILLVNTVINRGSVGRITADLYHEIEASGNEALLGIGREPWDSSFKGRLIGNKGDFYLHVMKNFVQGQAGFGSDAVTAEFLKWVDEVKPDLIHLQNIHGFYIQIERLFAYIKKRNIPVVWTLHDCWPFTGHCAFYDYAACDKWKTGCNNCIHHAKVYPYALLKDNSVASYNRKRKAFCGVQNLTIVTPSQWLKNQLAESFLKEYPVEVIYNGIDLDVFKPSGDPDIKEKQPYPIVLGVANVWEHRKGLNYFKKLARDLPQNCKIHLIGVNKKQIKELKKEFGDRMILTPHTNGQEELAKAYQEATVFVNATLEDNFPTTNLEAMACGTPVVTYRTGGSGESVSDKSGIVVYRASYDGLLQAVCDVLDKKRIFSQKDCRNQALQYDKHTRYQEYLKLYNKILSSANHDKTKI